MSRSSHATTPAGVGASALVRRGARAPRLLLLPAAPPKLRPLALRVLPAGEAGEGGAAVDDATASSRTVQYSWLPVLPPSPVAPPAASPPGGALSAACWMSSSSRS